MANKSPDFANALANATNEQDIKDKAIWDAKTKIKWFKDFLLHENKQKNYTAIKNAAISATIKTAVPELYTSLAANDPVKKAYNEYCNKYDIHHKNREDQFTKEVWVKWAWLQMIIYKACDCTQKIGIVL